MIIQNSYWNYYLAFRIKNYRTHLKEMDAKKAESGITAYICDDSIFKNTTIDNIMQERKCEALKQHQKFGKCNLEELHQMYIKNELVEYYFDFDDEMNDQLENAIEASINQISLVMNGYRQMTNVFGSGKCGYYVLMPIKVYFTEWNYVYCPVSIQLLTNGNGVIKLQMPLKAIDMKLLSNYPLRRWFLNIKIWEALYMTDGEQCYKILDGDTDGIDDIVIALQTYVRNFFSKSLVDGDRFIGMETFVITECDKYSLSKLTLYDRDVVEQMYRFAYPENFAMIPNQDELNTFFEKAHFNASGIHVVCGDRGRLIMYADVDALMKLNNRNYIESKNQYLNNSIAATFDLYILLALAQKDNEMTIYWLSEQDRHTINSMMVQYYANANYLDSLLAVAPKHGKIFYERVKNMLDSCIVDFNEMLHRMQSIELYEKSRLEEQQTLSLNRVTLVFTVFFGLPLIQETLTTIKTILGAKKDLIPKINCGQFSMVIWGVLLIVLLVEEIDRNAEYEGIKIEDDSLIRSKIKKGVLLLLMKIYKNKKS